MPPDDKRRRRSSGPVVRPYAVTGGRTAPEGEVLDLIAVIVATGRSPAADDSIRLNPEHRRLLSLCSQPITVADLAADTILPIGVVRVLLADLTQSEAITVVRQRPTNQRTGNDMLQEILNGLRAL
jgi:Protein of unknown function (DUF742)